MAIHTTSRVPEPIVEAPLPPLLKRRWFMPAVAAGALLGLVVLAIGLLAASFWMARAKAHQEVAREVARIQAAGEPITDEDFYAWHRVPAGTPDLTETWLKILAMTKGKFADEGETLPIVGAGDRALLQASVPDSRLMQAEAFLAERSEFLAAAHAAALQPGECRYPIKFEDGMGATVQHAQDMRQVARILSLDVHVKLQRQDVGGAIASIRTTIAAARTMEHQPTLVEQLVRIAVVGIALANAKLALAHPQATEAQLKELSEVIAAIDSGPGMVCGMLGERGMGYHVFHHLETLGAEAGPLVRPSHGKLTRPEDCLLYLQFMEEWIDATRQPAPLRLQQVKKLEDRLKSQVGTAGVLDKMRYMVTFMLVPALGAASQANARIEAERNLVLAAIAAERFRRANGEWPASLDALTPAYLPTVPLDPFDGKPLRMRVDQGNLVLYSIGVDGKDDHGRCDESKSAPDQAVRLSIPAPN